MARDKRKLPTEKATEKASDKEVAAFLDKVAAMPAKDAKAGRGRLIFALDATASRQPTWDRAAHIQAGMFAETAALGGLEIQVAFYRGFGEFRASSWVREAPELLRLMGSVFCLAGQTQIAKVLKHAVNETRKRRVDALVFVGDCVEEDVDALGALAGELGMLGVPAFLFHEGSELMAAYAFQQIAKLSGGACCPFDAASPRVLRDLLGAVSVYAAGGRQALKALAEERGGAVRRIVHQMKGA